MKLHYRELGEGQPLVFLHGLFGSADNWLTQSRVLSERYRTFALDLRNHGQSPHDDAFDYPSMVEDLRMFMEQHGIDQPIVVGHSMGGKVAMNFAVAHPDLLQRLVVVDIAPRFYDLAHYTILEGLKAIPVDSITTRQEADEALAAHVEEPDVRQFLLKNLQRKPEGGFRWKLNLPAIDANIRKIGFDLEFEGKYEKPTLFVRGQRSDYVKDEDIPRIKEVFPRAEVETLDAGHWVPAEKPAEFSELLQRWLAS